MTHDETTLGATYLGRNQYRFLVWAPRAQSVDVHILTPQERMVPMEKMSHGYYQVVVRGVHPGSLYTYRLDRQTERPDPASYYQPQDVHGPSQVVAARFAWKDSGWYGLPLRAYIIYELHVGTFTAEGTFEAIIPYLDELRTIGITASILHQSYGCSAG